MLKRIAMLAVAMGLFGAMAAASADAVIPTRDIAGARDNALLKRYDGSFIVSYERLAFTDFKVPLSSLEKADDDQRDRMNNRVFKPKEEIEVEGARTRIAYLLPAGRSPLEVLRNYQDVVKEAGGEVLYTCKKDECGGDPERSSDGGGGEMSLMMYFVYASQLKDADFSNGKCALAAHIDDQRFFAAKIPQGGGDAYVTVQTFQVKDDLYCKAFNERTVALVHIVEPKPREQKMVVVKAEEMARSIGTTGRVALYGIFFDTDRADLKSESGPTLAEIAGLLEADPRLAVLIVGHTDNQGAFDHNLDLSRRRAEAVVKALAANYRIDPRRLRAAGVGMMAPAASNDADDGRARNRRVEVVKLN
jgi:outer membrane protein OmpA-like peptidoglycan-associated protein